MTPKQPITIVLFLKNTDLKTVKNRAHFDLVPTDSSSRGADIDRAHSSSKPPSSTTAATTSAWAVLADAEGNEFCILNG